MFRLYFALILIVAALQLGISITKCDSRSCIYTLEKASRDVTKIDWKPISIFPEEAKRFR